MTCCRAFRQQQLYDDQVNGDDDVEVEEDDDDDHECDDDDDDDDDANVVTVTSATHSDSACNEGAVSRQTDRKQVYNEMSYGQNRKEVYSDGSVVAADDELSSDVVLAKPVVTSYTLVESGGGEGASTDAALRNPAPGGAAFDSRRLPFPDHRCVLAGHVRSSFVCVNIYYVFFVVSYNHPACTVVCSCRCRCSCA